MNKIILAGIIAAALLSVTGCSTEPSHSTTTTTQQTTVPAPVTTTTTDIPSAPPQPPALRAGGLRQGLPGPIYFSPAAIVRRFIG
jgi:PBP1b-binding outer membrane lipoprotein LpoB